MAGNCVPWVPEVFLACGGNFRTGHYKDLTETGNRARKVSGTQGSNCAKSEKTLESTPFSGELPKVAF